MSGGLPPASTFLTWRQPVRRMPQAFAARRSSKEMRYALFLTTMGADQRLEEQHQQHRSHYNRDSSPSRTTKLYRVEADRRGDIKQLYSHAISPYTRMAILCRCYHVKRSLMGDR